MTPKIARTDTDFNTIEWQADQVSITRQSDSHVQISRFKHQRGRTHWSILIDVTGGHQSLQVGSGNRLACLNHEHLLALTCGAYIDANAPAAGGPSLHNHALHYIHPDGQVLWTLPWQTIGRFTVINDLLLVLRYVHPPHYWIESTPVEAHLLDPQTGASQAVEPICIPEELAAHYQSWQVAQLQTYLVWKEKQLVVTIRPKFQPTYTPSHRLNHRGSFKHVLSFGCNKNVR